MKRSLMCLALFLAYLGAWVAFSAAMAGDMDTTRQKVLLVIQKAPCEFCVSQSWLDTVRSFTQTTAQYVSEKWTYATSDYIVRQIETLPRR